jgi:hypothetical protein
MIKQQRKNEKFNIRNAIEYAKDKDNAYNYDNCNEEDSLDDQNNDSNQISKIQMTVVIKKLTLIVCVQ